VIVVDASIVLAWVLPDSEASQRHAARIAEAAISGAEALAAPRLLVTECSYRLLKHGRTHRWGEAKIAECAEFIDAFGLRYYDNTSTLAGVVRFAVRHHVQGYDAVYLGLAMQLDAPLATLDGGLRTAARSAKVALA
jgi:predicted nucleic acid-binding protein